MGLLDVFSFKKEAGKVFCKEAFKDILESAKDLIVDLAKENIPGEKKKRTYVFPMVYDGKRSSLGRKTSEFSFLPQDFETVKQYFVSLPREAVPRTGGKGKIKQKKKPPKNGR